MDASGYVIVHVYANNTVGTQGVDSGQGDFPDNSVEHDAEQRL
jgi:hypothetical protein